MDGSVLTPTGWHTANRLAHIMSTGRAGNHLVSTADGDCCVTPFESDLSTSSAAALASWPCSPAAAAAGRFATSKAAVPDAAAWQLANRHSITANIHIRRQSTMLSAGGPHKAKRTGSVTRQAKKAMGTFCNTMCEAEGISMTGASGTSGTCQTDVPTVICFFF